MMTQPSVSAHEDARGLPSAVGGGPTGAVVTGGAGGAGGGTTGAVGSGPPSEGGVSKSLPGATGEGAGGRDVDRHFKGVGWGGSGGDVAWPKHKVHAQPAKKKKAARRARTSGPRSYFFISFLVFIHHCSS